jgi:CMP-N,N'-diacetyllegionaminic acid synthase
MRHLAVIPARGGSKGLPNKNILSLNGKPIIHYTIEAARKVLPDVDICVSTDSESIKEVAEITGLKVPFLRPAELSTDIADTESALLHALSFYEKKGIQYDTVILLQPTSPLRTAEQIKGAIDEYTTNLDMVVSVKKAKSNPYFVLFEETNEGFLAPSKKGSFTRRQDCPDVWEYNGAIYVINVDTLKKQKRYEFEKVKKYVMPNESSIDIDTALDLKFAELIMAEWAS